jgi:integration host factor subunit beta
MGKSAQSSASLLPLALFGVGLGWQSNAANGADYDLDASAFLLGFNGTLTEPRCSRPGLDDPQKVGYDPISCFFNKNRRLIMTKSELIERISLQQKQLSPKDVELAVKMVIEYMANSLSLGERIEIRGFGSFSLHYREPRRGRNPKTGDAVNLSGKYVPYFKPGKEMRERVNQNAHQQITG